MVLLLHSVFGKAQISPGKLSESHAQLEGISNCTKCHELGKKVTNAKCLDCHDEIESLLNLGNGFHANSSVASKDCFSCHNDHHGRKFDMIRFDKDDFDHKKANYALEGKHEVIDCRKCHVADNIKSSKIKKRVNTFLGLDQECLSCHDDYHQKSLSDNCTSCHDMEAFAPATKFNHNKTDYALIGGHKTVNCKECHKISAKNGKEFQQFSNLSFSDCKSCHSDPHNGNLNGKCLQCHTEKSFSIFAGQKRFTHTATGFELKGKHSQISCFSCHSKTSNPKLVFQDKINVSENNCVGCHTDEHSGKFGNNCAKCHNENSFLSLKSMNFFDHGVTDYPLKGNHVKVDCKQCHIGRFSVPLDYASCKSCHSDYHRGEFKKNNNIPDCIECHSLEKGFDYNLYSLEQHQETKFPLEGAHVATPCYACHVSEDDNRWKFKNLGLNCNECHQDIHQTKVADKQFKGIEYTCTFCHTNESWSMVDFSHNLTEWPLEGRHLEVNCTDCHVNTSTDNTTKNLPFNAINNECSSCHDDNHNDSFAKNGVTDCTRCHVAQNWFPTNFDHNTTSFSLEGKHTQIACKACHETTDSNDKTIIVYKLDKFECIDCHL